MWKKITILTLAAITGLFVQGALVINEVCYDNSNLADETGDKTSDWIEIYNNGTAATNVRNCAVSDKYDLVGFPGTGYDETKGVRLPNYSLAPGGFLLVYASTVLPEYTAWTNAPNLIVIPSNSVWRYLAPATAPAATWRTNSFNDASWASGLSPLGYNGPKQNLDCATVLDDGVNPAAYFRHVFMAYKPWTVTGLVMNARLNDGAVIYLNGREAYRHNMPAGTITYDTLASASNPSTLWISALLATNGLLQGTNVVAVEVHQASVSSPDLVMDLSLTAQVSEQVPIIHGQFGLDKLGEKVHLFTPALTRAHEFTAPGYEIGENNSYGLALDGVKASALTVFTKPTPGRSNMAKAPKYLETLTAEKPVFSLPPGAYAASQNITNSTLTPGLKIYYTLDGSDPRDSSTFIYSGQSLAVSSLPAATSGLAWIRTNPVEISNSVPAAAWCPPVGGVSQATVLRTITVSADNTQCSPETWGTYLIGPAFTNRTLPVVSLMAFTNDLFGFTNGIYVPGKTYADSPVGFGLNRWGKPYANYHQDSDDNENWERPMRFELFEPSQATPAVSQLLGATMHGGGTRTIPQKTLYLMARTAEYGSDRLNYPLFPDEPVPSYKRFLLRNGGNDWYGPDTGVATMMKDAVFHRIAKGMDLSLMAYRPAVTYLNGQYWGLHNLRESYDKHYLATRYGLEPDNVDILMHEENPDDPQKVVITRIDGNKTADEDYEGLIGWVSSNALSVAANYQQVQAWVDVTNLADYVVAETFFANTDWPINNCDFWRAHTNQVATCGKYGDTRWRWMLYDLDMAGAQGADFDMFDYLSDKDMVDVREPGFLINKLWKNMGYRNYFVTRYANLLNTTLRPERTAALIGQAAESIAPEIETHFRRWGRTATREQWQQSVNTALIQYTATRHAVLWGHLNSHFNLGGTGTLTVRNSDPGGTGGHFVVNGIPIETATDGITNRASWTGTFFRSLAASVQAVPDPGYVFAGWEGLGAAGATLSVFVTAAPQTLVARFLPEGSVGCTVLFDAQGGTVDPTNKYVAVGASYGTLPTPARAGYLFDGWWTEPDGAGLPVTAATEVTGTSDRMLYAKWAFATFIVTFDAQGGTVNPASTNVTFGSAYGTLPGPVRSGYTFAGWRVGAGGAGEQVTHVTTVTQRSDHTLYAAWTANIYQVSFEAHNGTGHNPASKSVAFGSAYGALPLPLPIRAGFAFAGWWTLVGGEEGEQIKESTVVVTASDHTLYADWTAIVTSTVVRTVSGARVTLTVTPALGISEWSCEETLPDGLMPFGMAVTNASCSWAAAERTIMLRGTGAAAATLSYSVTGSPGTYTLSGLATFDSTSDTVSGDNEVSLGQPPGWTGWRYPRADRAGLACANEGTFTPVTATLAALFTLTGTVSEALLTGDVDGDGALELVTTIGSELRLYSGDGTLKRTVALPRPCFPTVLEDADGDGTLDIGLGSTGNFYLYKGDGTLLKTLGQYSLVATNVTLSPIRLAGPTVLVGLNAGNDVTARGVAAFENASEKESWNYRAGPSNGNAFSLADMDGDGLLDITMRSATGRSGMSVNGTVDTNMVLVVVDENGTPKLSVTYPAPAGGVADHVFADLDQDGLCEILGFEGHDAAANKGTSQIHVFGADGVTNSTFNGPANAGWTFAVGDLAGDAGLEVVATSTSGETTYLLDGSLNKLLEKKGVGYVKLLCDLTGDGVPEIVTLSDKGLLRVLDVRLNLVASVQAGTRQGTVIASDINVDGVVEILCRSDKLYAFAFRKLALPRVNTFALDAGKTTTADRVVTLNNTCSNAPARYMASESPAFDGAEWRVYALAPTFTLSDGAGDKTVYFKVSNAAGESAVVSDTLAQPLAKPVVTSFALNAGGAGTRGRTVTLDSVCSGVPGDYQASATSTFDGGAAPWLPYSLAPTFELPAGKGTKTVYFRVRNALGMSATKSDTITLDETAVQVTAVASPAAGGTVTPAGGLAYTGKPLAVTAKPATGWVFTGWENGSLALARSAAATEDGDADGLIGLTANFKPLSELPYPSLQSPGAQAASVGITFALPLTVGSESALTVTAAGLPPGLKYDAARLSVAGVPAKAGRFIVTLTASNAKGAAVPQVFALTVEPLPTWAQGAFNGVAWTGELGPGPASMSVTPLGAVSGKIALRGTNFTFSAASYASHTASGGYLLTAAAKAGTATLPLTVSVGVPEMEGKAMGVLDGSGWVTFYRDIWKDAGRAAVLTNGFTGYYTATLPGGDGYGSGYLTFTVDKSGSVKMAGKLADGTAVSSSATLTPSEANRSGLGAVVYAVPPAYKGGGLFGLVRFVKHEAVPTLLIPQTGIEWLNLNPLATGDYAAGGFARELDLVGGWYNKVGNLYDYYRDRVLSVGTVEGAPAPALWAGTNRIESVWWNPNGLALTAVTNKAGVLTGLAAPKAGLPVKIGTTAYDYGSGTNTVGLTIAVTPATGLFKGSFKAWFDYATTHTSTTLPFEGALTPVRAEGEAEGRGFFLSPDKATYLSPATGKPVTYPFNCSYDFLLLED